MSVSLSDWLSCYIEFIDFEFQSSHSLIIQHAEAVLCRDVIVINFINDIWFWSEDHQLMLLSQQWDKMQDNLIYKTEDFWRNFHVINLKSEASSESLHKQDLVISESHDLKIPWLTVMWPESWQLISYFETFFYFITCISYFCRTLRNVSNMSNNNSITILFFFSHTVQIWLSSNVRAILMNLF